MGLGLCFGGVVAMLGGTGFVFRWCFNGVFVVATLGVVVFAVAVCHGT